MKPDSVILVNSGSTDKTSQIINEWINKKIQNYLKIFIQGNVTKQFN